MNSIITTLNKAQKEAVSHGDGPLLIIAGAGTGKTHVITERIKFLLESKEATPSEILALTFTEKAAKEMEVRVDKALPYGYTQMWITTFHSFGEKVLRQEGIHIGLNPGYRLMTEAEGIMFFRKNLFNFSLNYFRPLGNPQKFIESLLSHFSRLKDEDVSPEEYIKWSKDQSIKLKDKNDEEEILENEKFLELAYAYKKYEELKVQEGMMDFSDLISNTLQLFRLRKNILKEYQDKFKYILIDEFQDANFAQNQLAILLAGNKKNITVVGDDDQSIYRWRGAAISNIIQFRKNFSDAKMVVLRENYRSTQEILDRSYTLIQHNNPDRLEVKESIDKKLNSMRHIKGTPIEMIYTHKVDHESDEVAAKIKKIVLETKDNDGNQKYDWKDVAILVRANSHAEPFVKALQRKTIPYQFLGPSQLLRQAEIKDLIAYLKVVKNSEDTVSLYRVLSMSFVNIPSYEVLQIINFSRKTGLYLFEVLDIVHSIYKKDETHWSVEKNIRTLIPNLTQQTIESIVVVYEMFIRHMDRVSKDSAGQILYYFLEDSGLLKKFTNYKTLQEEKAVLNISKFFERLKEFEISHDDSSVSAVVDWVDMMMELGESPNSASSDWGEEDAVNILTIHGSKGLEFPIVFVVNLIQGRFPSVGRKETIPIPDGLIKEILPEGDFHLQEERRLFYVALTRARDILFLTASKWYGDGKRERKISPFVVEILGEKKIKEANNPEDDNKSLQLSFLDFKKEEEVVVPKTVEKTSLSYLSYSQIEAFNTCPLQYKYRYILKIPVPPTAAGSFGTSIHLSLQRFYEMVKRKENPSLSNLLKLLKDSWLPIGYGSRAYEDTMKKRGEDMLTTFYNQFYNPTVVPDSLEQVFKIKLSPELTIGGKIDRIDKTSDGKIEIVDYKTGKRPTDKQILENLQMTVYALAAEDKNIYNIPPENVTLTFYFFEKNEKVSSTRTKDQLVVARQSLIAKKEEIENSIYQPKVGPWCKFCDFKMICEAWQ